MKDLTQGSVVKSMLDLSVFITFGMLFQTLYYVVDLYFVSRLGKEATAGVGFASTIMLIVLALTQALAVGTTTLISHSVGCKDQPQAQLVFNQSFLLSLLVGGIVIALGYATRGAYVRVMSADLRTAKEGATYLLWFIPALGLQFAMVSMGAALRGAGIVRPTMMIQTITVVLNILLSPILITGYITHHPMGVAGAGLATLTAVAAGVLLLTAYFVRFERYVRFDPTQWWPRFQVWKKMTNVGLPVGAEFALQGLYASLVYWVTRDFGPAVQAGFGIGSRVVQSLILPVMSVSFAAAPIAGQNFGARLAPRVRQTFYSAAAISTFMMIALTMICQFGGESLIRFFSNDPQVVAFGIDYLHIISWNLIAAGLILTSSSLFQAMGNAWPALQSSSARLATFALILVILSRRPGFTIRHIWYLSVVSVAIQACTNMLLLQREFGRRLNFAAHATSVDAPTFASTLLD